MNTEKKETMMKMQYLIAVLALASATACSKNESKPSGEANAAPAEKGATTTAAAAGKIDMKAAKEIFDTRCSACHGANGKGDGPGAAALNPKPRNYTDKAWQAAVTDEQIKKTILLGGAAVGKSPVMPASPDLEEKPEVVDGLVKIVRQFGS